MTPQEVARKFLLENFDQDLFEFIEVVEWMDDNDFEVEDDEAYEKAHDAVKAELDTMIQRYADEEN